MIAQTPTELEEYRNNRIEILEKYIKDPYYEKVIDQINESINNIKNMSHQDLIDYQKAKRQMRHKVESSINPFMERPDDL